jgi:hypothetical protein
MKCARDNESTHDDQTRPKLCHTERHDFIPYVTYTTAQARNSHSSSDTGICPPTGSLGRPWAPRKLLGVSALPGLVVFGAGFPSLLTFGEMLICVSVRLQAVTPSCWHRAEAF